MKTRLVLLVALVFASSQLSLAQQLARELPAPNKSGGRPLMESLALRSTSRVYDSRELSDQQLSDLLWASFGINRPDGKRTAPSARNFQETDLYVLLKDGAFRYDAKAHRLEPVSAKDLREFGGTQTFVKDAPVTLVMVADLEKMGKDPLERRRLWAYLDVGYISQNIYLYCASEGLVTGARVYVDREVLGPKLSLRKGQEIVLAQCVAFPKAK